MKKLLSLDGGGSWALIQILTLREKYGNKNGHAILRDFDMVIANSGGSIVLAGLVANWTLDECLTLFDKEETRRSIFSKNKWRKKYFPTGITNLFNFGPKYSTTQKYAAFQKLFKSIVKLELKDVPVYVGNEDLKIIICTFDSLNKRAKFFKSYSISQKDPEDFDSMGLIKAIHGSSNAPVNYFDFPARVKAKQSEKFYYLWDGALGGFNNPVAAGLIEAIKLNYDLSQLYIISLGTANKIPPMEDRKNYYKLIRSVQKNRKFNLRNNLKFYFSNVLNMAQTILYEPPDWSNYVAYITKYKNNTNHTENLKSFIRLSPLLYCDDYSDKDKNYTDFMLKILDLDMDAVKQKDIELIKQCFEYWKESKLYNQPIKSDFNKEHKVQLEIGHKYFKDGLSAWNKVDALYIA